MSETEDEEIIEKEGWLPVLDLDPIPVVPFLVARMIEALQRIDKKLEYLSRQKAAGDDRG